MQLVLETPKIVLSPVPSRYIIFYLPLFYYTATFITHPWRIKDGDKVLLQYVGDSATLIINEKGDSQCLEHHTLCAAPSSSAYLPAVPLEGIPHPTALSTYGYFRQCGQCDQGIPICAFDCVSKSAVEHAAITLTHMLVDVDQSIVHRMLILGAVVGIIGKDQNTTDIPAHSHLKGEESFDGRDFDTDTRGLGGNIACPWTTVGEENVTMIEDSKYPYESILVHEFAHCVMNVGLAGQPIQRRIITAYKKAMDTKLYNPSSYIASNADEYWAEATQAWFEATVRLDSTSEMITRKAVKKLDPELGRILAEVWGDGHWRYLQTAPVSKFKQDCSHSGGNGKVKRLWKRLVRCR
jgi:hypothetical protein